MLDPPDATAAAAATGVVTAAAATAARPGPLCAAFGATASGPAVGLSIGRYGAIYTTTTTTTAAVNSRYH